MREKAPKNRGKACLLCLLLLMMDRQDKHHPFPGIRHYLKPATEHLSDWVKADGQTAAVMESEAAEEVNNGSSDAAASQTKSRSPEAESIATAADSVHEPDSISEVIAQRTQDADPESLASTSHSHNDTSAPADDGSDVTTGSESPGRWYEGSRTMSPDWSPGNLSPSALPTCEHHGIPVAVVHPDSCDRSCSPTSESSISLSDFSPPAPASECLIIISPVSSPDDVSNESQDSQSSSESEEQGPNESEILIVAHSPIPLVPVPVCVSPYAESVGSDSPSVVPEHEGSECVILPVSAGAQARSQSLTKVQMEESDESPVPVTIIDSPKTSRPSRCRRLVCCITAVCWLCRVFYALRRVRMQRSSHH